MSSESYFNFVSFNISHLIWIDYFSLILIVITFLYFQLSINRNVENKRVLIRILLSIANSILFISVIGLIIQPQFKSSTGNGVEEISIITSAENGNIDGIIERIEGDRNITYTLTEVVAPYSDVVDLSGLTSNIINSPSQLALRLYKGSESIVAKKYDLNIIGDGFNGKQVKSINKQSKDLFQKIIYESPENRKTGVIDATWDKKINLGEYSIFKADFQTGMDASNRKHRVRLLDPSGQLVEEREIEDEGWIEFLIFPKTFGLMTYKIEVFENDRLINSDSVAIEVTKQANLKMLILQSSPSFESKQIKNWAGDNNSLVVVNTNVNPKINLSRLTNVDEKDREKYKSLTISEQVLAGFDVLIIDSRRLNQLGIENKKTIAKAINDGLGVILLMDKESLGRILPFTEVDKNSISINKVGKENQSILYIEKLEKTRSKERFLLSESPITYIANSFQFGNVKNKRGFDNRRLSPLISNSKKQMFVAQIQKGLGKISYNLLKDTYRWVSRGEKIAHSQFWQHLIKTTARVSQAHAEWITDSARFVSGNKKRLCVSTDILDSDLHHLEIRSLRDNQYSKVLFNRSLVFEDQYCANYWAETFGWHQLKLNVRNNYQDLFFYVYPKESWLADQQLSKIVNTMKYKKQINQEKTAKISKNIFRYRKIELWIYWVLIILTLSYIWLERKYTERFH